MAPTSSMLRLPSQVGPNDLVVVNYLLWGAVGQELAEVEHYHPTTDRHDGLQHVLDDQDGDALGVNRADDFDHPPDFGRAEARHYLIQKQNFRVGGERPAKLQPLALAK